MTNGLALTIEGLSRLTRARLFWPVLGIGLGVALVWLKLLFVDAANARAPANTWDLVLMLQNNAFVLVFILLVPCSIAVGRLLNEDDESGYRSLVCLRLGGSATWVYPVSAVAVMLCTAIGLAIAEGSAWMAVGWIALGHLGSSWSTFAKAHSVYWLLPTRVLVRSPIRAALLSLLSNSVAIFSITCLAAGVGQWVNSAYGTVGAATFLGVLSLWLSHGTTGEFWSPVASGIWMLHGPQPLTPSLPSDWPWIYLSGIALAGAGLMVIRHLTLETW